MSFDMSNGAAISADEGIKAAVGIRKQRSYGNKQVEMLQRDRAATFEIGNDEEDTSLLMHPTSHLDEISPSWSTDRVARWFKSLELHESFPRV